MSVVLELFTPVGSNMTHKSCGSGKSGNSPESGDS